MFASNLLAAAMYERDLRDCSPLKCHDSAKHDWYSKLGSLTSITLVHGFQLLRHLADFVISTLQPCSCQLY